MQTVTSKVLLQEISGMLEKGGILETVVHHEIKEVGQHVLACSIQYSIPPSKENVIVEVAPQTFNKYYKFNVGLVDSFLLGTNSQARRQILFLSKQRSIRQRRLSRK
jgi:hypothetical protein